MFENINLINEKVTDFVEVSLFPKLEYFAITCIFYISSISHSLYNSIRPYYEKIPYIQFIVEETQKYVMCQYKRIIHCRMEPESANWSSIIYSDISNKTYCENYTFFNCLRIFSKIRDLHLENLNLHLENLDDNNTEEVLEIVLFPNQSKWSIRWTKESQNMVYPTTELIPSKIGFLSIEYYHPKMYESISILLDKRYLYTNNVIFSYTFIHRELEHQTHKYVFDQDYILKIMDSNINMIELTYGQYLQLTSDGYIIKINNIN